MSHATLLSECGVYIYIIRIHTKWLWYTYHTYTHTMIYATLLNEPCRRLESHDIQTSHVAHTNESRHTHNWCMSLVLWTNLYDNLYEQITPHTLKHQAQVTNTHTLALSFLALLSLFSAFSLSLSLFLSVSLPLSPSSPLFSPLSHTPARTHDTHINIRRRPGSEGNRTDSHEYRTDC